MSACLVALVLGEREGERRALKEKKKLMCSERVWLPFCKENWNI